MEKILLVNKPKGITSFDVCFKLRKVFGTKKIGHTGTLDPNATGLMIVLLGSATKLNQFLVSSKKEYIATVKLGIETDTLDIDGNIINEEPIRPIDKHDLINILDSFLGKSTQIPPLTSAISVNGKRLYEYQREGKEVEIPQREINVYSIELLELNENSFTFKTTVSSGTYIRSLIRDILVKLDMIGTCSDLKRTMIDGFSIDQSDDLEMIEKGIYHDLSIAEILGKYYPVYNVLTEENDIRNGKDLILPFDDRYVLCVKDDVALAIYQKTGNVYHCARGLW